MTRNNDGYFRIYRKIFDSGVSTDIELFYFWIYLMSMAKYSKNKKPLFKQKVQLKRGQICTSQKELTEKTGLSRQKIRSRLEWLEANQQITIKATNAGTIITICNYEKYNSDEDLDNQQSNQQNNHPITIQQPSNNHIRRREEGKKELLPKGKGDLEPQITPSPHVDKSGGKAPPEFTPRQFVALYHEILPDLPAVRSITPSRRKAISARRATKPDLDYWKDVFTLIKGSAFLSGRNNRNWRADLDWILKPDSHVKVIEGKYDEKDVINYKALGDKIKEKDHDLGRVRGSLRSVQP